MSGLAENWTSRPLSDGEKAIGLALFPDNFDPSRPRVLREKAAFFQPPSVTMAPDGNIWLHPRGSLGRAHFASDFSLAPLPVRAHFVHELTHVYQHQQGINLILEKAFLILRHGPFGGYDYTPGNSFSSYNIEQQACIMADHYATQHTSAISCSSQPHPPL